MVLTCKPIPLVLLETPYVYKVQDVHGNHVDQTSTFFWHPMLNNGVITNGGHLIQPLFDQEGFQKLVLKLVDSRGSTIHSWYLSTLCLCAKCGMYFPEYA